jgi:serine protease
VNNTRKLIAAAVTLAVAALSTASAAAAPAATSGTAIPNQYIVTLNKAPLGDLLAGLGVADQASRLLAAVGGGQVFQIYEHALRGFAVRMTAAQADLLRRNPLVAGIEPDQVIQAVATQSGATWGLDRIDQRNLPLDSKYTYPDQAGQGVHVYIIDTGINPNHSEFTGRVGASRNFVASGGLLGGGSTDPNAWTDCNGHGSHVSGTAAGTTWGVAKKATIHAIRVLDCNGSGSNSGVIAGVDYVTANHLSPAVANMSLGGSDSSALDTSVHNAVNSGVTFAVAAGNSNADACSGSPNKEPSAITVAASEINDIKASYSNYGSCVDIFAPGSNITSVDYSNNTGSKQLSGTSMATPHVTGAAALVLGAHAGYTPAQVAAQLDSDSSKNVLTGSLGAGSPNKLLYAASSGGTPVDNPPVASFTYSCTDLACSFNGSGSTDDHGVAAYAWNFGDASSGNGASVSHSYGAAGSYSVTLTVTDTVSQTNATSKTVAVTAPGGSPCPACTKTSGTLASGGTAYNPSSSGFASNGGSFEGHLRGTAGTDFDLYLEKYSSGLFGASWSVVARSETTASVEDLSYSGTAGTYRWRVKSYSGAGAYDLYVKNP